MSTRGRVTFFFAGLLGLLCSACGDPGRHYDDFLARADRTAPELPGVVTGVLTDVRGDFLYNIALKPLGDVFLQLRVTFTSYELNEDRDAAFVRGEFRFTDETLDASPLATFETLLDSEGRMVINVGRVRIEADRSPVKDTAVETEFILDTVVLDEQSMCGVISDANSVVFEPIQLQLRGTTFGGQRFGPLGELPTAVPTACPQSDGGGDPDLDAGDSGDAGDTEDGDVLEPPNVELGEGQRADITGRFWLKAALTGSSIELDLLVDMTYRESAEGASVDGSMRSVVADPAAPAIAQFSEPVDENGEFTVIIEDLRTDSALGPVEADIALRALIKDTDTLCGAAAGEVTSPLTVNLRGTTFGAVRIPDGSVDEPENALTACP